MGDDVDGSNYIANAPSGPGRYARPLWLASTLAIALLIGVLTLTPTPQMPRSDFQWDKVAHMVAFLTLVFPTAALWPRVAAWMGALAVAYGGAIEIVQPFTGRSAEVADLVADAVGVVLGLILGTVARRYIRARRTTRAD